MISFSSTDAQSSPHRFHRALWAAALILIVGGGLIMWALRGEAVFFDLAASLYAMCF